MNKHLKSVNHDYLRYANCWEDADVLLSGLDIKKGDKVLSIGSAGDNCFSLLTHNPDIVVAVDVNSVQLKLIELKKAAFETLTYQDFLAFLGFDDSDQRIKLYGAVRKALTEETKAYWDDNFDEIKNGIIHQGKFENYFHAFRKKIMPLIHSRKSINELLALKSGQEQSRFYDKKWNTFRWRSLFKMFFSKLAMGRLGRDPKFLNEVEVPVSQFILEKAKAQLSNVNCQSNYFLDYIFKGKFTKTLPHYARPENFNAIRRNLVKLELFQGYAEETESQYGKFNKFNLSNIFEYMDIDTFTKTVDSLIDLGMEGARFAYWNLMVPRSMASVSNVQGLSNQHALEDKGFFYSKFHINQK